MNRRLNSLKSEIGASASDFKDDTKSITNRVNSALDADPEERKIHMRQRFIKVALIAATIVVLGTSTVFAYVNIGSDFLRTFFTGDTSYLDEFVQTPGEYVADEGYVLTLEQTLVTAHQALVIFSVEALTDETIAELNATDENGFSTFMGMDTIDFGPADSQSHIHNGGPVIFGGWMNRELVERRTDTKRYFAITVADMSNEEAKDFFIRLNKMANPQKIIIPMGTNIETHAFVLACGTGEDAILQFTPLGIIMERTVSTSGDISYNTISGLYFRMHDGEINTFNQLLRHYGISLVEFTEDESEYLRYEMSAFFREIMSISEFESIILDNVEYDISDTSITTPFTPDPTILPFEMQPYYREHLWVLLEELCENIGADLHWDSETNSAVIEYRNSTFELEADSTVFEKNGETIDFYDDDALFVSEDGRLIVSGRLLDLMGIGIVAISTCDNGEFLPVSDWTWIIIP